MGKKSFKNSFLIKAQERAAETGGEHG